MNENVLISENKEDVVMDQRQIDVINELYKCILTPESWGEIMNRINDDIGAFGINLLTADKVLSEMQNCWMSNSLKPSFQAYLDNGFIQHEMPTTETLVQSTQNVGLMHTDLVEKSHNRLSNNKVDYTLLNKWLLDNYGVKDRYIASLNKHASHFDSVCLSFLENQNYSQETVQRCNVYLPHIANLVKVSRPFLLLKARFNSVLNVLDRFRLAVFLLDNKGDVIERNTGAQRILDQRDGLFLDVKNRLQLTSHAANAELYNAINKLTTSEPLSKQNRNVRFATPKDSGASSILLEVSALMHYELPIGALVIVADPDQKAIIDTSHFTELFGLTPSEQEVCQLLAQGSKSNDIADIRNTTIETSRGQIKSVLTKTQTFKQTELVRLALSVNIPVDQKD